LGEGVFVRSSLIGVIIKEKNKQIRIITIIIIIFIYIK
jgi:hypothetical protein